ncbi:DUF1799 domain-containing protein, partial [Leptospira sp. SA-E8]|uniref:DUF1799 domain-containing protein n=1 Tax=Leptospira sp. SA-E8 TaxID=3422259 RepID=UPI003EB75CD0
MRQQQSGTGAAQDVELWFEHANAWNVFLSCNTQWRVIAWTSSMHWIGLDY